MTTTKRRWAAVGAAVSAAAAVIAGGMLLTDKDAVSASDPPGAGSGADSASVQERANEVFEEFNGTVRQRNASGVLEAWSLNGAMDSCMEEAGFPAWDWSANRNLAPRTNALATSVFFAGPPAHSYSDALMDIVVASRAAEESRNAEPSAREDKAITACLKSTPAGSAASTPGGIADLNTQWWSMLRSLDREYGNRDAYAKCFRKAVDASDVAPDVTAWSWDKYLAQHAPRASRTPADESDDLASEPAWVKFLETEAELESIDWSCREAVYKDHIDDVAAAIDEFRAEHIDAISQAVADWEQIEADAAELGFHGQAGSLD